MTLFTEIKESAEGRELSTRWFRSKIASLGGSKITATQHIEEGNTTARPNYGMMNLFSYRPETAERLPYYDLFPLVIPVQKSRDGFTGLNFHYLPIPLRLKLLDLITEVFMDTKKEALAITWSRVSTFKSVRPIVRRYKAKNVDSLFLKIPAEDMLIASLLPVQRFYKGEWRHRQPVSDRVVWRNSRHNIRGN